MVAREAGLTVGVCGARLSKSVRGSFYGVYMSYRRALERLTTLSSQEIDDACRGVRIQSLTTRCMDELMELTALADEALADYRIQEHVLYSQEVAAWSETVQMLRIMADDSSLGHHAGVIGAA